MDNPKLIVSEVKKKNGISNHIGGSPRVTFKTSPSKVGDSRQSIARGFNLDYCWFCGRPMNGWVSIIVYVNASILLKHKFIRLVYINIHSFKDVEILYRVISLFTPANKICVSSSWIESEKKNIFVHFKFLSYNSLRQNKANICVV